jgi:hypothetical protein
MCLWSITLKRCQWIIRKDGINSAPLATGPLFRLQLRDSWNADVERSATRCVHGFGQVFRTDRFLLPS